MNNGYQYGVEEFPESMEYTEMSNVVFSVDSRSATSSGYNPYQNHVVGYAVANQSFSIEELHKNDTFNVENLNRIDMYKRPELPQQLPDHHSNAANNDQTDTLRKKPVCRTDILTKAENLISIMEKGIQSEETSINVDESTSPVLKYTVANQNIPNKELKNIDVDKEEKLEKRKGKKEMTTEERRIYNEKAKIRYQEMSADKKQEKIKRNGERYRKLRLDNDPRAIAQRERNKAAYRVRYQAMTPEQRRIYNKERKNKRKINYEKRNGSTAKKEKEKEIFNEKPRELIDDHFDEQLQSEETEEIGPLDNNQTDFMTEPSEVELDERLQEKSVDNEKELGRKRKIEEVSIGFLAERVFRQHKELKMDGANTGTPENTQQLSEDSSFELILAYAAEREGHYRMKQQENEKKMFNEKSQENSDDHPDMQQDSYLTDDGEKELHGYQSPNSSWEESDCIGVVKNTEANQNIPNKELKNIDNEEKLEKWKGREKMTTEERSSHYPTNRKKRKINDKKINDSNVEKEKEKEMFSDKQQKLLDDHPDNNPQLVETEESIARNISVTDDREEELRRLSDPYGVSSGMDKKAIQNLKDANHQNIIKIIIKKNDHQKERLRKNAETEHDVPAKLQQAIAGKEENNVAIRANIPIFGRLESEKCEVCGHWTDGFHYGARTCDGCRAFFRRNNATPPTGICAKQGKCEITVKTRRECQPCRFKKCLEVGMTANGFDTQETKIARMKILEEHSEAPDSTKEREAAAQKTEHQAMTEEERQNMRMRKSAKKQNNEKSDDSNVGNQNEKEIFNEKPRELIDDHPDKQQNNHLTEDREKELHDYPNSSWEESDCSADTPTSSRVEDSISGVDKEQYSKDKQVHNEKEVVEYTVANHNVPNKELKVIKVDNEEKLEKRKGKKEMTMEKRRIRSEQEKIRYHKMPADKKQAWKKRKSEKRQKLLLEKDPRAIAQRERDKLAHRASYQSMTMEQRRSHNAKYRKKPEFKNGNEKRNVSNVGDQYEKETPNEKPEEQSAEHPDKQKDHHLSEDREKQLPEEVREEPQNPSENQDETEMFKNSDTPQETFDHHRDVFNYENSDDFLEEPDFMTDTPSSSKTEDPMSAIIKEQNSKDKQVHNEDTLGVVAISETSAEAQQLSEGSDQMDELYFSDDEALLAFADLNPHLFPPMEEETHPLTQTETELQNSENQDETKTSQHENLIDNGSEEQQGPLDPHVVISGKEVAQQPVKGNDDRREEVEQALLKTLDIATAPHHDPDSSPAVEDAVTNERSSNGELHRIVEKNQGEHEMFQEKFDVNVEEKVDERAGLQDVTPGERCTVNEDERIQLLPELESQEIVDQHTIDRQSEGEMLYDPADPYGTLDNHLTDGKAQQLHEEPSKVPTSGEQSSTNSTIQDAFNTKRMQTNAARRARYAALTPEKRNIYIQKAIVRQKTHEYREKHNARKRARYAKMTPENRHIYIQKTVVMRRKKNEYQEKNNAARRARYEAMTPEQRRAYNKKNRKKPIMKNEDENDNASKVENQDETMLEKSAYPLTQTKGDFQNSENQDATKKSRHENLIDNGSEEQQDPLDPHVVIAGEEVAQQPVEAKDHQRKEVEETLLETLDVATASDHDPDSSQAVEDAGTNESSPNGELHRIIGKNQDEKEMFKEKFDVNVEKQSDERADLQDVTPEERCTVNEDERIELLPELESQEIVDQQTIDPQSGGERLYDPSYGVFAEMEEEVMRQLKVAKWKTSDDVQNQEKRIYRPSKKLEEDGKTTDWAAKRLKRIMNQHKWNATSRAKYQAMTPEQRRNYRNRKPMMKNEDVKSNASKVENQDGKMLQKLEKPQDYQAEQPVEVIDGTNDESQEQPAPKKFKLCSFFPLTYDN